MATPERLNDIKRQRRGFCYYGPDCSCGPNELEHLLAEIDRLEKLCKDKDERIADLEEQLDNELN